MCERITHLDVERNGRNWNCIHTHTHMQRLDGMESNEWMTRRSKHKQKQASAEIKIVLRVRDLIKSNGNNHKNSEEKSVWTV